MLHLLGKMPDTAIWSSWLNVRLGAGDHAPTTHIEAEGQYGGIYNLWFSKRVTSERRQAAMTLRALRGLGWQVHISELKGNP